LDGSLLIMLGIAALGVISKNHTIAIALLLLALLRLTHQHRIIPVLEKHGITLGVIVLTVGVMSPLASGKVGAAELMGAFTNWRSIAAVGVGALVAYLGGRGVRLMSDQPLMVNGLLLGTVIGVAVFRGVPVGPLIAAGILAILTGKS
jgi:uncharacterized membrane protein (DUF441 family)